MGSFKVVKLVDPIYIATNGVALAHTGETVTSGTFNLYEGNNITFTTGPNALTIHGGAGAGGGVAIAGGTQTATSGTVNFANSNGITFGMSGSTRITASHNGITLQTTQPVAAGAANGSFNFSTLSFIDSNGVSFATSTDGIRATVKTDYLTSQSNQAFSAPGGSSAFQTLTFANSNGVSFSNSNGSLVASVQTNYLTSQSNQAVSAANGSFTFQTLTVANSNGVSFSTGTQGLYATVKTDYAASDHSHGNPTLALTNISGTTASNSNGLTLSLSANPAGGADGVNILAAGTQTANTTGTVLFNNANGITFGMSNSSVITASHNGLTTARASNDAVGLNTALTAGPLAWTVNSSGISLNAESAAGTSSGFGGNLISGSMTHNTAGLNLSLNHPAWLTTAMQSNAATISNIRVSAGTTSNLLSALTFADSNGISFGINASTITATVKTDYLTSQSNQAVSANNGSYAFQTLSFSNANGISFGTSAGSAITASHNAITTARASTDAIGLNTAQTNVTWTVNSSGLSLNAAGYAGTGTSKTGGAVITLNSNGLAFDGSALAGTATTFNGANISGSMTVNTAGVNLSMSVAAPGAAAENNNINLLGANTAGNTTASGSTIGLSGINLTLSGTNNSVVNISAPATSSLSATGIVSLSTNGSTISIGAAMTTQSSYWEGIDAMTLLHAGANGNISVERFKVDQYVSATMIGIPQYQSISSSGTANTYGQQWSIYAMVLTNDTANNRLMSLSSGSTQTTYTMASNNAGATQIIGSGVRPLTVPININMTPGIYYMAFNLSTNTFSSGTATTALNRTASFIGRGPLMSASFGMVSAYDVATGNTVNRLWPQGVVSGGASAGIPATISHSQMTMTGLSHSQANLAFYMRA